MTPGYHLSGDGWWQSLGYCHVFDIRSRGSKPLGDRAVWTVAGDDRYRTTPILGLVEQKLSKGCHWTWITNGIVLRL